jgi:ubiquinone/menaquinone biosynthesis C-methylase UbiE
MPVDHMEKLYNSNNPLVRFAHRQRLGAIAAMLPKQEHLKVLDAGCGEGHLIQRLSQAESTNEYYGVDVTGIALERARARCPFARFKKMDISALKFEDGYFDVITITEVLEHIIEYESAILELRRVLKPSGVIIITFPNEVLWTISRSLLGRRPIKVLDHVNAFNPRMIRELVEMEPVKQFGLPFRLPFCMSLGYLMKFKG